MIIFDIKKALILLLLFINMLISSSNRIVRIPIGLINTNREGDSKNIIKDIFYNLEYANITIGTPPQIIPCHININSRTFFISNKYFDSNQSSTYELLFDDYIYYELVTSGLAVKDKLKINNKEIYFNFILANETKKDYNISNLGLLVPKNIDDDDFYSLFASLKKEGLINSFTWSIKYFSNISLLDTIYGYEKSNKAIGELIIGDEPHNYEQNKSIYNETEFIKINTLYNISLYKDIEFNSIYLKTKKNKNDKKEQKIKIHGFYITEINPDIEFIVGTSYFFSLIKDIFFINYEDICIEKFLENSKFRYIECDKDGKFKVSSFPDIYFENKEFGAVFTLTYEDLFIYDETNNKYIFLILNDRSIPTWIFGSIFLRKYQLVFEAESKTIGYYKSMTKYLKLKKDENLLDIKNKNYNKKDDNKDKKIDKKNKEDENNKKEDYKNKNDDRENENEKDIVDINEIDKEIDKEIETKRNENENNYINKDNKEDQIKNKENDSQDYSNNQIWKNIIYGLIFIIFSVSLILLGMFIQRRCFDNQRKRRLNELEEGINETEMKNSENMNKTN